MNNVDREKLIENYRHNAEYCEKQARALRDSIAELEYESLASNQKELQIEACCRLSSLYRAVGNGKYTLEMCGDVIQGARRDGVHPISLIPRTES